MCCSVVQCVAVCGSVLQCGAACCSVLQCWVLQCVAAYSSMLQQNDVCKYPPSAHALGGASERLCRGGRGGGGFCHLGGGKGSSTQHLRNVGPESMKLALLITKQFWCIFVGGQTAAILISQPNFGFCASSCVWVCNLNSCFF